jgi:hypothetical protein
MLLGHFGIAQLGKGARRDLPLSWLILAAFLPDVVRELVGAVMSHEEMLSHSLPAMGGLAIGMASLWRLRGGTWGAASILAIACMLHWPADVFTGCKPTWPHGAWIGFDAYRRPVSDLTVEGIVFVAGWLLATHRGAVIKKRWLVLGFAMQVTFLLSQYYNSVFLIGDREWSWRPATSLVPQAHSLERFGCKP